MFDKHIGIFELTSLESRQSQNSFRPRCYAERNVLQAYCKFKDLMSFGSSLYRSALLQTPATSVLYFDKNVIFWARLSSQEYPEKISSGCGVDGTRGRWVVGGGGGGGSE